MVEISLIKKEYKDALKEFCGLLRTDGIEKYLIRFEADHTNSKIIRDFVGAIFDAHKIYRPWRGRFILITDELVNNAIEHGSAPWDIDTCVIEAWRGENDLFYISFEVEDSGNGKKKFDAEQLKKFREQTQWGDHVYLEKRGRGLFHITEKLVDKLSFSEGKKGWLVVRVEKSLQESDIAYPLPS